MQLWIADGVEQIGLCEQAGFDVTLPSDPTLAWQQRLDLGDAWQADAFVQRHLREASRVHELRGLLARQTLPIHRLSDEQVLQQVANELRFGTLRADRYTWRERVPTRSVAAATVKVVAPLAKPAPVPERVEAVEPEPIATVAPAETPVPVEAPVAAPADDVAQVQEALASMLEKAAQEATPFCEVCEQVKAQQVAAATSAEQARVEAVQDAQAGVLEQAAENGTPFCEICERGA
ncbi:hypothetical protein [Pseudomonas japonica]|uniref:Uncharacterized protein n=1 Tax=Pseudomonas japonica TaxID=256466 RepID=A0A239EMM1_9PSED|nr:hypothetical protein [Pseudomonas japonica]SNS46000.1 hypothetical protein SAMN05444352_10883 [Pseudomonas japonica]